ncbi:MAG: hypothetical protein M1827_007083 [Pycnora praestabilis]|nr:MAG: hypothetical protein M1827_007083 [Pycnora praestabilis]
MQPSNFDLVRQARDGFGDSHSQGGNTARQALVDARAQRSEDSWVEIASQPSSSSLSSAAADDIVTTGLRVSTARRRRQARLAAPTRIGVVGRTSSTGSSQEEYEESESEPDHILTSSNEGLQPRPFTSTLGPSVPQPYSSPSEDASSDDDDDDENSTALGVTVNEPVFTPQPNAFSHPPSSSSNRHHQAVPDIHFPAPRSNARAPVQRQSYPDQRTRQNHTPYNMVSPSYQADHDAALRASLSTLLSCAAAARGLSKQNQHNTGVAGPSTRIEPGTIRIVPESVVMGEISDVRTNRSQPAPRGASRHPSTSSSNDGITIAPTQDKGKRKASSSKDRRVSKKTRTATLEEMVSPTLLTWVVSAGVVVLVSAISFSAGYAMGKEAGRAEVGMIGVGEDVGNCGKEAMKGGLRRLRWGSGGAASVHVH